MVLKYITKNGLRQFIDTRICMILNKNILDIIEKNEGSSFYLLDSNRFKNNYYNLLESFKKHYSKTTISYSYKTNYIPAFCKLVNELGGSAEVVSGMEMTLAQKIGVKESRTYFNGPYKEKEYVEKLLIAGGSVNIDSIVELLGIVNLASQYSNTQFRVGIRCNFDIGDGIVSRFGIDVFSTEFKKAIEIIDNIQNLKLAGLHCHFASRSIDSWENRTKGMLQVLEMYFQNRLESLEYISLGGGLYGPMPEELKTQFEFMIPGFDDYAFVSAKLFSDFFRNQPESLKPVLIIEPGTALAADSLKYVTKVISLKNIRSNCMIGLSGSIFNINPIANRKNVPLEIFPSNTDERVEVKNASMVGYTCVEGDYLYKNYNGMIGLNDFVVFNDVGTYSVVMKPPFIKPNVAVVEICSDNINYTIIKRKETFEDVFKTYNV